MYLNVNDPESSKYDVIDLITSFRIPGVQEANDETGEFTVIMADLETDELILNPTGEVVKFQFKGYIKIVKKENTK